MDRKSCMKSNFCTENKKTNSPFNEAVKLLVFTIATRGRRYGIMLFSFKNWTFHFRLISSSAVSLKTRRRPWPTFSYLNRTRLINKGVFARPKLKISFSCRNKLYIAFCFYFSFEPVAHNADVLLALNLWTTKCTRLGSRERSWK